ncbi:MAG: methyltransferase domain-containing protein [Chloroflexi bacterium]|nr:methyltransferase domain-containing protein [Chloroflexota bacterium]
MRKRIDLRRQGLFLQGFLRQWRTVGAIIPSGDQLGRTLAEMADRDHILRAVELGPGTGALTRPLLARLRPDAHLLAVEIYAPFADHLRDHIGDARAEVVTADARRLPELLAERGWPGADLILSSIPMTPLDPGLRGEIADAMQASLRPGGQLLMWQYTPFIMEKLLRPRFHIMQRRMVFRNVPPAVVYGARSLEPALPHSLPPQRRTGSEP